MKIALCAIIKNENLYINEWINYHLNLGIDHIYIYDNNDINCENPNDIINNSNVTIIDFRGKKYAQSSAYTNCYKLYKSVYDWFLFIDIDEFLVFEKIKSIKDFINLPQFKNQKIIRLNWKHYTDNDLIDVINNNYNVFNRFTKSKSYWKDSYGKSLINADINLKKTISAHEYCDKNQIAVDVFGHKCFNEGAKINNKPIHNIAWINHYRTKTIGEFIRQKYFRGDATKAEYDSKYSNLKYFFDINTYTKEKEEYAKKLLKTYNI